MNDEEGNDGDDGEISYTTFEPPPRVRHKYWNRNRPKEKRKGKKKKKKRTLARENEITDVDESSDSGSELADEDVATLSQFSISSASRRSWPLGSATPPASSSGGGISQAQQPESAGPLATEPGKEEEGEEKRPWKGLKRSAKERAILLENEIDPAVVLPPQAPTSLQEKHLLNVNTIMHLSLMKRDWKRAKRAFKLMLGSFTDLRPTKDDRGAVDLKGMWEIGVEILALECEADANEAYKSRQEQMGEEDDSEEGEDPNLEYEKPKPGYGGPTKKKGEPVDYTKVTDFLERLIVMYPYNAHAEASHRHRNKLINSKTFLPTLLHYRILTLTATLDTVDAAEVNRLLNERGDDVYNLDRGDTIALDRSIRSIEAVLDGVDAMLQRLTELQLSAPWVDMGELWELRGFLNVWGYDIVKDYLMCYPSPDDNYGSKVRAEDYSKEAKKAGEFIKQMGGQKWDDIVYHEGGGRRKQGEEGEDENTERGSELYGYSGDEAVEASHKEDRDASTRSASRELEQYSGNETRGASDEETRGESATNITDGLQSIRLQSQHYMRGSDSD